MRGEGSDVSETIDLTLDEETGEMRWRGEIVNPESESYELLKDVLMKLKARQEQEEGRPVSTV